MTVEDAGNGEAFMYSWDGSGTQGDDLYFNVSVDMEGFLYWYEGVNPHITSVTVK